MNKHMIRFQFKHYRGTLLKYSIIVSLLTLLYAYFYPFIEADFAKLIEQLPKELIQAMQLDQITNFETYFRFFGGLVITIGMMMLGFHLGTWNMNQDRIYKTQDYVFTRPISRLNVLISKVVSGLLLLVLGSGIMGILFTIVLSLLKLYGPFVWEVVISSFLLSFASMMLALFMGSFIKTKQLSLVSISLALIFYAIQLIQQQMGHWTLFKIISLADYFPMQQFNLFSMLLSSIIIFIVCFLITYVCLIRMDIDGGAS